MFWEDGFDIERMFYAELAEFETSLSPRNLISPWQIEICMMLSLLILRVMLRSKLCWMLTLWHQCLEADENHHDMVVSDLLGNWDVVLPIGNKRKIYSFKIPRSWILMIVKKTVSVWNKFWSWNIFVWWTAWLTADLNQIVRTTSKETKSCRSVIY